LPLIDTHAHIYLDAFAEDRDDMLQRARDAGIEIIVMPAIDVKSIHDALDLAARYDGLYVMSAIHPTETKDATDAMFNEVADLCGEQKVVAVGESGLDYYWDRSFDDVQQRFLRMHAQLAVEKDLPLILHNREAGEDLVSILSNEKDRAAKAGATLRGIFHCFGGPVELGRAAIDLGFLLGIGGTLTFKNSGVADVVANFDLSDLVLETDSPFLAPVPHRGKRNEPSFVKLVAEKLADVKTTSMDEVVAQTSENARRLFAL
jgi:TatD DNase family protein